MKKSISDSQKVSKNSKLQLPETVNADDLGKIMGMTGRRVQMLEKESIFEKKGRGQYVLAGAGGAYAKYLANSEIDRRESNSVRELVDIERARKLKLENDQLEGKLVDTQLAIAAVDKIVGVLQSELAGLPAMASDDVVVRRKVEHGVEQILTGLQRRFEEAGGALAEGRDPFDSD